jgi:hypothetical protein
MMLPFAEANEMKTLIVLTAVMLAQGASAQDPESYVRVTGQDQDGAFTLACEPLVPVGELPDNWVELCNQQGQKLLQHESSHGNPVQVIDEPFGMAGRFAAQTFASLPEGTTPELITSPDLRHKLQ